jgi:hypothetical protein
MRAAIVVICLLAATGCDENSPTAPTVSLGERVTLAPREVVAVRDTDLRVQFVRVSGDSRCPADALCILGGDALVHVRVREGAGREAEYELHTGDSTHAAVVYQNVRIALSELQPYPFSARTIAPDDYRATLTVTRP